MRRLLGFVLTGESLGMVARSAGVRTISVESPIPESATFFTAFFCHERNAFVCVFEDESFARVCEGGLIPIVECPTITELDQQPQTDPAQPKQAIEYNTCKTCLAADGRAGLLFNGECENCYRTRESGTITILTHLHRTETELQRTMQIIPVDSVEKSTNRQWPEVERNLTTFDPLTDTCETAFEKWIRAGQKVGRHVGDKIRFELWVVWRTAWECSQKVSPDA